MERGRSPVRAHHLSEEDRSIYRRWARRSTIAYFIIIAVLAVGLWLRDKADSQLASRDQTIAAGMTRTAAPQVTGGISKSN